MRRMMFPLLVALLASAPALSQPPPEEPLIFEGRQVAHVMSYLGAPWLEREERDDEEDTAALLAKMNVQPGQRVADIGCGSGYHTRRLAKSVGPEGYVFAVDVQPRMLEILKKNVAEAGVADNVVPVLGQAGNPHLPAGEIDWILLVDVYHEFQDPASMLAAMHESLTDDGRVALAEYRLLGDSARHIKREHRMSIEQVRREWEPAGFELVEVWEELPTQHLFIFKKAPGQ